MQPNGETTTVVVEVAPTPEPETTPDLVTRVQSLEERMAELRGMTEGAALAAAVAADEAVTAAADAVEASQTAEDAAVIAEGAAAVTVAVALDEVDQGEPEGEPEAPGDDEGDDDEGGEGQPVAPERREPERASSGPARKRSSGGGYGAGWLNGGKR